MNRLIDSRQRTLIILVAVLLSCFATRRAQAVLPPPDGGYPGGYTPEGQAALLSLTTGGFNTAVGFFALKSDTSGQLNTAIGAGTLFGNGADENTATGAGVLFSNTTGFQNTATGAFTLFRKTTGFSNIAIGVNALFNNTTGNANGAVGDNALTKQHNRRWQHHNRF